MSVRQLAADDVLNVLARLFIERGVLGHILSDQGVAFRTRIPKKCTQHGAVFGHRNKRERCSPTSLK